jgi:hypothetical protein
VNQRQPSLAGKELEEEHEPGLAAALFVLDPVPAAVPVLPGDPLQVLHLEGDESDDPECDACLRHKLGFLPDRVSEGNSTFE